MSKKPIKSSLFRFVTLRSPQAIEDKENKIGLILPDTPVKTASTYYQAVAGVTEGDEAGKKAALEGASFTALEDKTAVKAVSIRTAAVYDFSAWLMRNRDYLTYASVSSNLPASYLLDTGDPGYVDMVLTDAEQAQIWDNLLYQTINRTSTSMREVFIQMLIASSFAKHFKDFHDTMSANLGEGEVVVFTDQDEEEFTKRANASVVIEKEVLLSNKVDQVAPKESLPPQTKKVLENELAIDEAQLSLNTLKNALKELDREEEIYEAENQAKYDTDLAAHQASVDALLADSNNFTSSSYTDPDTSVVHQIDRYTGPEIPTFSFTPVALDFQNSGTSFSKTVSTDDFLSTETQDLLQLKAFADYGSFSSLRNIIKESIKEQEEIIVRAQDELEPKQAMIGGSKVTVNKSTRQFDPYCYTGQLVRRCDKLMANKFELSLKMFIGRQNATVDSYTASLSHAGSSTNIILNSGSLIDNSTDMLLYKFALSDNAISELGKWDVSIDFTFANGDTVELRDAFFYNEVNKPGTYQYIYRFSGCATVTNATEPTDPVVTPPSFNGVANLGIADFIRVEQEICCYVPGEVSHIENIMAKEYKEKSTRSLVSSEITSEQTSEREVEQLTDTTSTERSELQSEVSSVIDQQNSTDFGASTSVSGGKTTGPQFTANASFGNSSSTASSNSNSQAQSYAQDITERALERVVEKVSSKRTSRVLREYEENNKHGFDNTKGENHITGVYRWVDKIYENKLVNYGKRLMYEFSIPEPSRFLKQALIESSDFDTSESGLLVPSEPKHPQHYVTSSNTEFTASYLGETNYQRIAAKYNAQVNAYPDSPKSISKGSGSYAGSSSPEQSSQISFELNIPENYVAKKAVVTLNYGAAIPATWNSMAFLTVGGKSVKVSSAVGTKSDTFTFQLDSNTDLEISDTLAVSVVGSDVGAISCDVTAFCELTDAGKQQWQNETFNAIMDAYYDRVNEYNDFIRAEQDLDQNGEAARLRFNPAINRAMERRELKRCAIELLTKETDILLAKDRYSITSDNIPSIKANDDLKKDVAAIKFFEQAFDWEIMAYTLYPYYYAKPGAWEDLMKEEEDGDPIFQSFLQSGIARMVVPVRPGFEAAVNWYEATGEIWEGQGMVTDINDELYLSVAEELTDPVGVQMGDSWNTQVPTSLTIVQAKSAYLDDGGLPCRTDCENESQFGETTLVISGGTGSNAADGVGADIVGSDNNVA